MLLCDPSEFLPLEMSSPSCRAESQDPTIPPLVTDEEMYMVVEHLCSRRKASGPDKVLGRLLALGLGQMGSALLELFAVVSRSDSSRNRGRSGVSV